MTLSSILNRRTILLISFMIALFVLVVPAGASGLPYVKWRLDVDVVGTEFKAERVNQLWWNGNLVHQWKDEVPCNPTGNVTVANGVATFAGGYVNCALPDLQMSVWEETNHQLLIAPVCETPPAMTDVWMQADLANVDMVAASRHPIFSHPDYQVSYALNDAGGGQFTAEEEAANISTTSNAANLILNFSLGARINQCSPANGNCVGRHFLNGSLNGAEQTNIGHVSGTTGPTTVTIGADAQDYFYGDFLEGHLDPGCIATQG